MYHQDWLMRQIEIMVDMIAKIIFKKDNLEQINIYEESKSAEIYKLYETIISLTNDFKLNEAEDMLFEKVNNNDLIYIKVAMDFYDRLNKLSDEELQKGSFTREEIQLGLKDILNLYGMDIGL